MHYDMARCAVHGFAFGSSTGNDVLRVFLVVARIVVSCEYQVTCNARAVVLRVCNCRKNSASLKSCVIGLLAILRMVPVMMI